MTKNSLEAFIERVSPTWAPLNSELVAACRQHLEELARALADEDWLLELHRDEPENKELYRHPTNGFLLLAHTEWEGLYRPPHDHGRGWAIYAVQRGIVEMGTYIRMQDSSGRVRLVKRDAEPICAGQVRVFLPGDIHDTRCIAGPATLLRFTDRDLKKEDKEEGKVTRYVEQDGVWTERAA